MSPGDPNLIWKAVEWFNWSHATMGRCPIVADCPFCGAEVHGYRWSVAGTGKKCDCGAVLGSIAAWKQKENA